MGNYRDNYLCCSRPWVIGYILFFKIWLQQ